jgi:hypothetical protein
VGLHERRSWDIRLRVLNAGDGLGILGAQILMGWQEGAPSVLRVELHDGDIRGRAPASIDALGLADGVGRGQLSKVRGFCTIESLIFWLLSDVVVLLQIEILGFALGDELFLVLPLNLKNFCLIHNGPSCLLVCFRMRGCVWFQSGRRLVSFSRSCLSGRVLRRENPLKGSERFKIPQASSPLEVFSPHSLDIAKALFGLGPSRDDVKLNIHVVIIFHWTMA